MRHQKLSTCRPGFSLPAVTRCLPAEPEESICRTGICLPAGQSRKCLPVELDAIHMQSEVVCLQRQKGLFAEQEYVCLQGGAASVYLQSWMQSTCSQKLSACRDRRVYLQNRNMSACRAEPQVSTCRAECCLPVESEDCLQSQKQSSCIARNSLRPEPIAVSMARPNAHILSYTNLDMYRDLKE